MENSASLFYLWSSIFAAIIYFIEMIHFLNYLFISMMHIFSFGYHPSQYSQIQV